MGEKSKIKTRNFYQEFLNDFFNFGSLCIYLGGDFLYDENEIEIMAQDCEIFANSGVNGLVFGCLDKNAEIDVLGRLTYYFLNF